MMEEVFSIELPVGERLLIKKMLLQAESRKARDLPW